MPAKEEGNHFRATGLFGADTGSGLSGWGPGTCRKCEEVGALREAGPEVTEERGLGRGHTWRQCTGHLWVKEVRPAREDFGEFIVVL